LGAFEKATAPPPRITSTARQGDDLVITWVTAPGKTNTVQATNDLGTNFADITGPIIVAGNGDVTTNYTEPGGLTNYSARFYRVRMAP
jgi:hypothetical protein